VGLLAGTSQEGWTMTFEWGCNECGKGGTVEAANYEWAKVYARVDHIKSNRPRCPWSVGVWEPEPIHGLPGHNASLDSLTDEERDRLNLACLL
jgi:hypothetical protein